MKKLLIGALSLFFLCSCTTVYYKSWELLGREKRDLLSSNIESLKGEQEDAKEEFSDVLERMRSEYIGEKQSLAETYSDFKSDYDDIKDEVDDVTSRLNRIDGLAKALFKEWLLEANEFDSREYRRKSLAKRGETMRSFNKYMKSTRALEAGMNQSLKSLQDEVVFLKHNLNSQIVSQFNVKLATLEKDMEKIIGKIEKSIEGTDSYIKEIRRLD
ncbi:MAG: DUF2959 family protein [Bdellovibrionota bacterium]|nr:DUF2959 family protein [Bdellovibrionota bacterium]